MQFEYREIFSPEGEMLSKIVSLWKSAFGDDEDFILSFYASMPVAVTVGMFEGERLVSMAALLSVGEGYYGYAVCTDESLRGRGLCRMIHEKIREKCERENKEYFIHPADESLSLFYRRLGMHEVLSSYEVTTFGYKAAKVRKCSPSEYAFIRDAEFGAGEYYPWSEKALAFMESSGIELLAADIDGIPCAAAVEDGNIIELCAPEYLLGKASSTFLPEGKNGKVRFLCPPCPGGKAALMSFSGREIYFNLFLE